MKESALQVFRGFPFIGYWSDRGRAREENEDSFYVPPENLAPHLRQRKGYLCIVADGMGGHARGEVASALAARRVAEEYYADPNPNPEQSLRRVIQIANGEVLAASQQTGMNGMGTTLVAAVSLGNQVVVANVGDSRAYLISQGRAQQITRDHSLVQARVEQGMLTEEQARQHAQKNLITRALGTRPHIEVDVFRPVARDGDRIMICSDGLSNMVRPDEIAGIVSQLAPDAAAKRLVALANERGGPDNSSVVIMPAVIGANELPVQTRHPVNQMWMPVAAGGIFGIFILLLISLYISRQSINTTTQAESTQTAMVMLAATTNITRPATAITGTKTASLFTPTQDHAKTEQTPPATTPTSVASPAPVPSAGATAVATAPVPGIIVSTVSPTPTVTATMGTPPTPEAPGELDYQIPPRMRKAYWLTQMFQPPFSPTTDQYKEFYKNHLEIHSSSSPNDISQITEGPLKMTWADLSPKGLADVQKQAGVITWVYLLVDDGTAGILDTKFNLEKFRGQWIVARGAWQSGRFKIEPPDFLFVKQLQVYTQVFQSGD